jgi:hypothetical protein
MNDERQKHKKLNKNTPLFITLIQSASTWQLEVSLIADTYQDEGLDPVLTFFPRSLPPQNEEKEEMNREVFDS